MCRFLNVRAKKTERRADNKLCACIWAAPKFEIWYKTQYLTDGLKFITHPIVNMDYFHFEQNTAHVPHINQTHSIFREFVKGAKRCIKYEIRPHFKGLDMVLNTWYGV